MRRALLVDDDPSAGLRLREEFERSGFSVTVVGTGEALRSLKGTDLVLANIYMPQKDGLEVIRAIHPIAPDLPIIGLSGGPSWQSGAQQEANGPARTCRRSRSSSGPGASFPLPSTGRCSTARSRRRSAAPAPAIRLGRADGGWCALRRGVGSAS
jgi:CheY-like chemotaxis protein